jgi:hypothetical protein
MSQITTLSTFNLMVAINSVIPLVMGMWYCYFTILVGEEIIVVSIWPFLP